MKRKLLVQDHDPTPGLDAWTRSERLLSVVKFQTKLARDVLELQVLHGMVGERSYFGGKENATSGS